MTEKLFENNFAKITPFTLKRGDEKSTLNGLDICHAHCQATLSLYGGQVLSFKPNGHKDVLWLSDNAQYQTGKAIRGGIPLCWPWFGENDKQSSRQKADKHGFARQLPWQIESTAADESGVTLILVLKGENQHPLWPNAYQLTQTIFFGKSFKQSLAMRNLSEKDAQYSTALHSYFTVSQPKNVTIDALTGVTFDDKLTGRSSQQSQAVSCIGEIDRVYHSRDKMTLIDHLWQRKIEVSNHNCQQWILWNPGTELANTMADIHSGGEQEYVCLEAANSTWQELPAGETVTISQEIEVTNL
ncbi:MAG: D-hexose-6-phosphate mutarotase [Colwellia sp.]|nr:D-hexose-6-phosphate mutarotase [Colwellia sp.]